VVRNKYRKEGNTERTSRYWSEDGCPNNTRGEIALGDIRSYGGGGGLDWELVCVFVDGWPSHDIVIANSVWYMAYTREVEKRSYIVQ